MSFIVATSHYYERLRRALERGEPGLQTLSWTFGPGPLAVGLNGLSLISIGGSQVLLNGYLSNRAELETLLDAAGSSRWQNDADLILALVAHRGQEIIQRLKGCFATLIIHPTQQIVATRDRLGGRTLYCLRDASSAGQILSTCSAWVQRLSGKPFEADPAFMASHFLILAATLPVAVARSPDVGRVSDYMTQEVICCNLHDNLVDVASDMIAKGHRSIFNRRSQR